MNRIETAIMIVCVIALLISTAVNVWQMNKLYEYDHIIQIYETQHK